MKFGTIVARTLKEKGSDKEHSIFCINDASKLGEVYGTHGRGPVFKPWSASTTLNLTTMRAIIRAMNYFAAHGEFGD